MTKRGPYLSSTEARERMLAAGAEMARQLPATDPFVHLRAIDIADAAGMSKSGVYRNFASLDDLHTASMVEVARSAAEGQRAMLAADITELLSDVTDEEELLHQLARDSFAVGLEDGSVDMSVLLASLADDPDIAAAARESERASLEVLEMVYRAIDERIGGEFRDGVDYADVVHMVFAAHDGLAIWRHCDPDAVPLDLEGPAGVGTDDNWDAFSIAVWAIVGHLRPAGADDE